MSYIDSILIKFEYQAVEGYLPDFPEKLGNLGLGLLRMGFGKTVRVRPLIGDAAAVAFEENISTTSARVAKVALSILTLPLSLLLAPLACIALSFSTSHREILNLYRPNQANQSRVAAEPTAPPPPPITPPDVSAEIEALQPLQFGDTQHVARGYEEDLETYYRQFSDAHFSSIRATRQSALASQIKQFQTVIVGAGPAGLIAAYEAYIHGAHVVLVEQRTQYSRDQILRMEPATYAYLEQILGPSLQTVLGTRELIQFLYQGQANRRLFTEPNFYTIETRDLEQALSTMLKVLSERDPQGIAFYQNHQFLAIHEPDEVDPHWRVRVKDRASQEEKTIAAEIIVGADGGKSRVREAADIAFTPSSSTYTYSAATFYFPEQFRANAAALDVDIPQIVYDGARLSTIPNKDQQIGVMRQFRRRTSIVTEMEVLSRRISAENRADYERSAQGQGINTAIELTFVREGARAHLQYLKDNFGWKLERLPISRFFTSANTVYIGGEFPEALLRQLHEMDPEGANARQLEWLKAVLRAHLPDRIISMLRFKHSNIFPVALSKTASPYKRLASASQKHSHVLLLGDSFATPHFLTGSGAQHAIHMGRVFGDLLSKMSRQPRYMEHVTTFEDQMRASASRLQDKAFNIGMLARL